MAIGLGALRAAERSRRAGRAEKRKEPARASVREVCLIGLDRRTSADDWPAGQEVAWLGRQYQVVATAVDPPKPLSACGNGADAGPQRATARQYVHLTSRNGD
jgi:hypothetical protein